MLSPYDQLRLEAKKRRDEKIRAAKAEFRSDVKQIAAMIRKFNPRARLRTELKKPMMALIIECVCGGDPFTSALLMTKLEQRFQDRNCRFDCVRRCVGELKKKGAIERIGFNEIGSSVYAWKSHPK